MAKMTNWSPVDKGAGRTPESRRPIMIYRWCHILD